MLSSRNSGLTSLVLNTLGAGVVLALVLGALKIAHGEALQTLSHCELREDVVSWELVDRNIDSNTAWMRGGLDLVTILQEEIKPDEHTTAQMRLSCCKAADAKCLKRLYRDGRGDIEQSVDVDQNEVAELGPHAEIGHFSPSALELSEDSRLLICALTVHWEKDDKVQITKPHQIRMWRSSSSAILVYGGPSNLKDVLDSEWVHWWWQGLGNHKDSIDKEGQRCDYVLQEEVGRRRFRRNGRRPLSQ